MSTEFKVDVADNRWVVDFRQNVPGPADPYDEWMVTRGKLVAPDLEAVMVIVRSLIVGDES